MKDSVSATGYTSVLLVLNMRRFIADKDQQRFERIRGTPAFHQVLRNHWPDLLKATGNFVPIAHDKEVRNVDPTSSQDDREIPISIEEVAYLTGIFRLNAYEDYMSPTYYLSDKDCIHFPREIRDNVQFKNFFIEVWNMWDIFVRPTSTGMFVVRLRRRHSNPTPLLTMALEVVRLQMAFDLRSARRKLRQLEEQERNTQEGIDIIKYKKDSIRHFLRWLGSNSDGPSTEHPEYVPVQWKLAMEVCRQFVHDVGLVIPLGQESIQLRQPEHRISTPLHDSYVVYHIDELYAVESLLARVRGGDDDISSALTESSARSVGESISKSTPHKKQPIGLVKVEDIYKSEEIQNHLIGLLEGAILKKVSAKSLEEDLPESNQMDFLERPSSFPYHHAQYLKKSLDQNLVTWSDEVCLLAPRAAIIMPSRRSIRHELLFSNFSATKDRIMYARYWEALERMIEFVVEIRVLAQLLERQSSDLLQDFEREIHDIRSGMWKQNVKIDSETLRVLTEQVTNLSRLLGFGHGLSTPRVWSRTEFAASKANSLLQQQDVPILFNHTERNVNSLNSLINHVDELYLADLSEKRNNLASLTSLFLGAFSLLVALFAIPSFWNDSKQITEDSFSIIYLQYTPVITTIGTILAIIMIICAILLIIYCLASFNTRLNRYIHKLIHKLEDRIGSS